MHRIVRRLIIPTSLALGIAIAGYMGNLMSSAHGGRAARSNRVIDLGTIVVTPDDPRDREILAEKLMQDHRYTIFVEPEKSTSRVDRYAHDPAKFAI